MKAWRRRLCVLEICYEWNSADIGRISATPDLARRAMDRDAVHSSWSVVPVNESHCVHRGDFTRADSTNSFLQYLGGQRLLISRTFLVVEL